MPWTAEIKGLEFKRSLSIYILGVYQYIELELWPFHAPVEPPVA